MDITALLFAELSDEEWRLFLAITEQATDLWHLGDEGAAERALLRGGEAALELLIKCQSIIETHLPSVAKQDPEPQSSRVLFEFAQGSPESHLFMASLARHGFEFSLLEQGALYVYVTVATQGDLELQRTLDTLHLMREVSGTISRHKHLYGRRIT